VGLKDWFIVVKDLLVKDILVLDSMALDSKAGNKMVVDSKEMVAKQKEKGNIRTMLFTCVGQ